MKQLISALSCLCIIGLHACQKDHTSSDPFHLKGISTTVNGGYGDASKSINAGLAAYYPFTGNANDASGNGNNGTIIGASLSSDRSGKKNSALAFNGLDNVVNIPNSPSLNPANVSISVWFKIEPADLNTSYCILQKASADGQPINLSYSMFVYRTNTIIGTSGTGSCATISGNQFVGLDNSMTVNGWNHFVETITSSGYVCMYINGVLNNTYQGLPYLPCSGSNTQIRLGKAWSGDPVWFKGKMDEVRIYNRILNQSEVSYLATH